MSPRSPRQKTINRIVVAIADGQNLGAIYFRQGGFWRRDESPSVR
ncbi:MAG: hypothetical protein VKJ24_13125 [Synechococcales bacterium]|nr:hypothetical protein [Synechococcales bacterium]